MEEKRRSKLKYTLTDVILPSFNKNKNNRLKIFDNFERWYSSMLSMEIILQKNMEMANLIKTWKYERQLDKKPNILKLRNQFTFK